MSFRTHGSYHRSHTPYTETPSFMSDASCPELKEFVFHLLPAKEQFELSKSSKQWHRVAQDTLEKHPAIRAAWSGVFTAQNIQTLHFRHNRIDLSQQRTIEPREIARRERKDRETIHVIAENRVAVWRRGNLSIYAISDGRLISRLEDVGTVWASSHAAPLAAAHTLLGQETSYDLVVADGHRVDLYNVESGQQVASLRGSGEDNAEVEDIVMLASGRIVVSRSDGSLEVGDPTKSLRLGLLCQHLSRLTALAAYGERVVAGSKYGEITTFELVKDATGNDNCVRVRGGYLMDCRGRVAIGVRKLLIREECVVALEYNHCPEQEELVATLRIFDLTAEDPYGGTTRTSVAPSYAPCSEGGECLAGDMAESLLMCGEQVVSFSTRSRKVQIWNIKQEVKNRTRRVLREPACGHNNGFSRYNVAVIGESVIYVIENKIHVWNSKKPDQPPQIIATRTEDTIYGIACTTSALLVQYLNHVDVYEFGISLPLCS